MRVVAIDPGTTESALVVWDGQVIETVFAENLAIRERLRMNEFGGAGLVAIEMVASYGMAVGQDVFETVRWLGRFQECSRVRVKLVYRKDVKIHLCGSMKAKDANIRQALIDKHGPAGTMKNKGKLYGISGHLWAALAVADFAAENLTP